MLGRCTKMPYIARIRIPSELLISVDQSVPSYRNPGKVDDSEKGIKEFARHDCPFINVSLNLTAKSFLQRSQERDRIMRMTGIKGEKHPALKQCRYWFDLAAVLLPRLKPSRTSEVIIVHFLTS